MGAEQRDRERLRHQLLRGSVGVGTVLYAALIGPITHRTIPLFTPGQGGDDRHGDRVHVGS